MGAALISTFFGFVGGIAGAVVYLNVLQAWRLWREICVELDALDGAEAAKLDDCEEAIRG